ncbi:MAG: M20/M25/M40 family metallo-hydrolase [Bacteroidales bacterium]|nr:M20/M25/M40 family metallo-hydrolase [Bacteroidales bacterium]
MKRIICIGVMVVVTMMTSALFAQNEEDMSSLLPQINVDSLLRTVNDLESFGSRFALRDGGNREVAEYLVQRLENYGINAVIDSFYNESSNWIAGDYAQWFYNVKGVLASENPKDDSTVIVGAHLDAISYDSNYGLLEQAPGADDNASGVAVMMELARICHENGLRFKRDIHFMAYDGEELGLLGSYDDAWRRVESGDHVAVMLNNDMVSYQPDDDWKLTLHWYDNSLDIVSRAAEICSQYTNIAPVMPTEDENVNSRYSDSYAYYYFGFRTVFAIENTFSTSYHTYHDVSDSNNYDFLADVARYNMAMLVAYTEFDNTVGVEEHTVATAARLYPNPVTDKACLQYQLSDNSPVGISVTDLLGRTMLQQNLSAQTAGVHLMELDLSQLPSGIYLCRLRTNKGAETLKITRK